MVIDSSALLAVVLAEPDAQIYIDAIACALMEKRPVYVPASVLLEAGIVADARNCASFLDALLGRLQPEIVPLDRSLAELARQVFRRFGKRTASGPTQFRRLHELRYRGVSWRATVVQRRGFSAYVR